MNDRYFGIPEPPIDPPYCEEGPDPDMVFDEVDGQWVELMPVTRP